MKEVTEWNNVAILHIYRDMVDKFDIEKFSDYFITKNSNVLLFLALWRE